MIGDYELICG